MATVGTVPEWIGTVLEIVQMMLKSPSLDHCYLYLFTHSFNKHLWSNYYVTDTLLDT